MKTLLEKFVEKATIASDRSEEDATTHVTNLSVAAQSLFGVERIARNKLEYRVAQVKAESKFVKYGWRKLPLEPLGWTKGILNIKPAFSIFRIDDAVMSVQNGKFDHPKNMPDGLTMAFQPAFEITKSWSNTFTGVLPPKIKEAIIKVAPLFEVQLEWGQKVTHLFLVSEANKNKDEFILVGWDGSDLWLVEDYVESISFDEFMQSEFATLSKGPQHLSLPEYNPYGGDK